MPLSTVLGAQSLVQPAVCTTATRPASPYEGQTIYDTTTDTVLSYNGTSFVTIGPTSSGLAFISSTAVSGTSVSVNNCFSSTYNNYRIIYTFSVADQNMTMRLRVGGVDNSSANYGRQRLYVAATAVQGARTTGATSWTDFLGSDGVSSFIVDIFNPFLAAKTGAWIENGYNASTDPAMNIGSLQQQEATSFDGFTIAGSGTMTGTCVVYGYAKA